MNVINESAITKIGEKYNLNSDAGRAAYLVEATQMIASAYPLLDEDEIGSYIRRVASAADTSREAVLSEVNRLRSRRKRYGDQVSDRNGIRSGLMVLALTLKELEQASSHIESAVTVFCNSIKEAPTHE